MLKTNEESGRLTRKGRDLLDTLPKRFTDIWLTDTPMVSNTSLTKEESSCLSAVGLENSGSLNHIILRALD